MRYDRSGKPRSLLRRRWLAAFYAVVAAMALTSCGGTGCGGSSSTPAGATKNTTPKTASALPCAPSGHSVDTQATTLPATTSPGVSWAGVFERVYVKTDMSGAVSKTPSQHTLVAAAGKGTATVNVPVSGSNPRHSLGQKPTVTNGVAQVKLNLKHKTHQHLKTAYDHPLPLSVKVDYRLNGHPISGSDIKGKSGQVEVDYRLTNTTSSPVHVCFTGFNGTVVKKTVTAPAPIYAYVSLTLPKHVSQFSAPGAFMNADRSGVNPQWLVALFKPLGTTTQTLKLTMDTSKAKIPKATVLLEFVQPEAVAGSAPAKSAVAVGKAQADAAAAAARVQADVAALQSRSGKQHHRSHRLASSSRNGSASSSPDTRGQGRGSRRSPDTPVVALAHLHSELGTLKRANRSVLNIVGLPTTVLVGKSSNSLSSSAGSSIDTLTTSTSRSINSLTASTNQSIDQVTRATGRSLQGLASDLRRSIATHSLKNVIARAAQLQHQGLALGTRAGQLVPAVSTLAGNVQAELAALSTPVDKAAQLYLQFGQLKQDLDAFDPAVKTSAAFLKLQADVAAGETLAKNVTDSLNQIQAQAQAVVTEVEKLQQDVLTLHSKIAAMVQAAVANAEKTRKSVLGSSHDLGSRLAADISTSRRGLAGPGSLAQNRLAAAQADARGHVTAAGKAAHDAVALASDHVKASVARSLRGVRRSVAAEEQKVKRALAHAQKTARAALAAAKQAARQGGQAALAAAQASAAKAAAAAQRALTKANTDYANLLGLNQRAVAWELPGGDATNVTEQEGSFIYTIAGS